MPPRLDRRDRFDVSESQFHDPSERVGENLFLGESNRDEDKSELESRWRYPER